jgi:hypothetical protein
MSDHVWFGKEILPYINRLERRVETLEAALRKIANPTTDLLFPVKIRELARDALASEPNK